MGDIYDQSPLAWELHKLRGAALHNLFDKNPEFQVMSWGDTDCEERTHEFVTITLVAIGITVVSAAGLTAGLAWLGRRLIDRRYQQHASDAIVKLTSRLRDKLRSNEIAEGMVVYPHPSISSVTLSRDGTITIYTKDGTRPESHPFGD